MISLSESRGAQCDDRLCLKTQEQTLIRQAMDGAGLTRWEAEVLPRVVEDIYFQDGANRPWKDGQVRYQCVDITAGPGRKLSECPLVPTALTVIDVEKDREVLRKHGAVALRQSKLMRIAEEAREQGGVLTQEDLGVLLSCDERTIRRDIKSLRAKGIHVPTRGYVQDIGPTLSHKGLAIRHWLEGKEPVAVARSINHSLTAVERYLEDFKRVSLLVMKGLDEVAIARAANLSPSLVKTYHAMYQEAKERPHYAYRFKELSQFIAGEPADHASSGKKGAL
jgi:biotin operon repressor